MPGLLAALADLVLPEACAGCAAERVPLSYGVCAACATELERLMPGPVAPDPPPPGMPPCTALGPYGGALRGVLLAYKEKGRHRLAAPLGRLLAGPVAAAAGDARVPVLVLAVPSTARAVRHRHGDHLARTVAHTVRHLRAAGWDAALVRPLRALPRPDSAALGRAGRAAAAQASLRVRPARLDRVRRVVREGARLVVVDDIVTTGATLAAVAMLLTGAGVPVAGAATLAATQRRDRITGGMRPGRSDGADWANLRESVVRTKGDSRASRR
jgi:predicted amidophosphoribosyltransferase